MQTLKVICMGAMLGAIGIIFFNYSTEWVAHFLLSWHRPSLSDISVLFQLRFSWIIISGAALGAFAITARYMFVMGKRTQAANLCIIGGFTIGLVVALIAAKDTLLVFQVINRSQFAKFMTSHLLLWKINYILRGVATNTPLLLSLLLLFVGLMLRQREVPMKQLVETESP